MLSSEDVTTILHALATGYADRALNVVVMSTDLDDDARAVLAGALAAGADGSTMARRMGDALRSLGAERHLVNECYRVAFYAGDEWLRLLDNPLFAYHSANRAGRPLDKWVHYFPIYERHLARYRGVPVRVLEIGVYRGGGLDLLRAYLGPDAVIVGIDIDPDAPAAVDGRYPVEVGDQADPTFLREVSERHGPFDVVIDDGGHTMVQQITAVETLFPLLRDGGTYLVEDCHTSYWASYADQSPGEPTFVEWAKARIDDLHAFHVSTAASLELPWQTDLAGLHAYDSVVVLERGVHAPPFSELSGTKEFIAYNRELSAMQVELLATRDAATAQAEEARASARTMIAAAEADAEARVAAAEADAEARVAAAEADAEARIATTVAEQVELQDDIRVLRGELGVAMGSIASLQARFDAVEEELAHTRGDLLGAWGIIQEMRRSRSWRLTAPLRSLRSIVMRR